MEKEVYVLFHLSPLGIMSQVMTESKEKMQEYITESQVAQVNCTVYKGLTMKDIVTSEFKFKSRF